MAAASVVWGRIVEVGRGAELFAGIARIAIGALLVARVGGAAAGV